MNNDLISRKALIEAYDKAHKGPPGGARKLMEEAPGVDSARVVHGEWSIILDDYANEMMQCSICGAEFYDGDNDTVDHFPNYCPNCGAKMDGGKEK